MPATTVAQYLAALPADRRQALEAVRAVILKNLDKAFEEGIQYNMIGYYVPHSRFPAGYHCDPKQPLPFAGLASQKGHMSLYMMGMYCDPQVPQGGETRESSWFREAWAKTGKKLDMGKACVRFKKLEDVALEVVGEAFRRLPAKEYIERYQAILATRGGEKGKGKPKAKSMASGESPVGSGGKKKVAKKPAKKPAKKKVKK